MPDLEIIYIYIYTCHVTQFVFKENGKWEGLKQESGIIRLKCYKDHTGCCMTDESEENPTGGRNTC